MGWFKKEDKPQQGEIRWSELPEEEDKLSGGKKRPVIVTFPNNNDTSRIVPCTTKYHPEKGDIKIDTTPTDMNQTTYARLSEGEQDIDNNLLDKDEENRRLTNSSWKKIWERL